MQQRESKKKRKAKTFPKRIPILAEKSVELLINVFDDSFFALLSSQHRQHFAVVQLTLSFFFGYTTSRQNITFLCFVYVNFSCKRRRKKELNSNIYCENESMFNRWMKKGGIIFDELNSTHSQSGNGTEAEHPGPRQTLINRSLVFCKSIYPAHTGANTPLNMMCVGLRKKFNNAHFLQKLWKSFRV